MRICTQTEGKNLSGEMLLATAELISARSHNVIIYMYSMKATF